MTVVVALLRAVNVGGRTVRSADLKAVAADLGYEQAVTYAASGNLVLVAPGAGSPAATAAKVATDLSAGLRSGHAFDVPVIARDASAWRDVVRRLPFPDEARNDPSHLLVHCWDGPVAAAAKKLDPAAYGPDSVVWSGSEAYVYYPAGSGTSKLTGAVLAKAAGRVGTSRNWRTVLALDALAQERAG